MPNLRLSNVPTPVSTSFSSCRTSVISTQSFTLKPSSHFCSNMMQLSRVNTHTSLYPEDVLLSMSPVQSSY